MAKRDGVLRVEARLVEAVGQPFVATGESFHDPGVALDYVRSLEPRVGPSVVRVYRVGRAGLRGDAAVVGYWLCEAGGGRRLRRRGSPARPEEGSDPAHGPGPLLWWERSARADRMVREAAEAGVDRRSVGSSLCGCVRLCAHLLPAAEAELFGGALSAAEAWSRRAGAAPSDDLVGDLEAAAWNIASAVCDPESWTASSSAVAVYGAAYFCSAVGLRRGDSPGVAGVAIGHAAGALAGPDEAEGAVGDPAGRSRALAVMASVVRSSVATLDYLRSLRAPHRGR